jgi:hypothetical protein
MKKQAVIDPFQTLSDEERLTREGGEKLRLMIIDLLRDHSSVILDFKSRPIASVSFWDEGIAKLLQNGFTEKDLKEKINLKNVISRDHEVIQRVCEARKK